MRGGGGDGGNGMMLMVVAVVTTWGGSGGSRWSANVRCVKADRLFMLWCWCRLLKRKQQAVYRFGKDAWLMAVYVWVMICEFGINYVMIIDAIGRWVLVLLSTERYVFGEISLAACVKSNIKLILLGLQRVYAASFVKYRVTHIFVLGLVLIEKKGPVFGNYLRIVMETMFNHI
ncbi:hypothetical protein Tco_0519581 [Tanacetum coccineum]